MELNRDVTRKDILYGVLKRMDEVIDSISNTVSTKDFLVRDIIYDLDRLEEAKLALVAVLEDMSPICQDKTPNPSSSPFITKQQNEKPALDHAGFSFYLFFQLFSFNEACLLSGLQLHSATHPSFPGHAPRKSCEQPDSHPCHGYRA